MARDRRLLAGFAVGVALAVAVALASFLAIGRLQEDGRRVAHTQEVMGALEAVLAGVTAAQTAVLGYVVQADDEQIEHFEAATRALAAQLTRTRNLVGSPALAAYLPPLGVLIEQRLAHQRELLDLRRREGLAAAQAALHRRDDDAYDHAIRDLVGRLAAGERERLQRRLGRSERSAHVALLTVGLGSLLSVGLAGLGLYSVRRGFAASRRAQADLELANAALDRRVLERTEQLHASRELLEHIIASAPSAIFAMDREHRYTATNPAHLTICGRPAEEALRGLNAELERRVAERTAEAESANAAKSRFLAQVSHEVRNPLNAMLGLAQVLESESLTPEHHQIVRRIRSAGRSLLGIINDVLDFSKIEAGQLRVELWPFEVRAVLAQVDSLMGELARAKGLDFRIDLPEGLNDRLLGDPLRLEQVLVNLTGNAVKFTERGAVRIGVQELERSAETVRLRFEVEDTGMGIPPERLPTLGRPFAQSDSSIPRRFGGTGLGLSISKHLVELMGGRLDCDSTPGVGSRFWFELPCARTTEAAPPSSGLAVVPDAAGAPAGPRLPGLHCLVVDDSEMNRDVLERALLREGARVSLAADGQQALLRLRADPAGVSAVLMDIQMPVMDGLAATRAIRAEPLWQRLPVVAFSAAVLPEQRQAALDAGVDDFLAKPVDLEELVRVLYRVRSGQVSTGRAPDGPLAVPPPPPPVLQGLDFPAIAGLDTRRAAGLLGGDRAFFIGLLRQFAARFGSLPLALREDLAQGHAAAAARRLHTMRGIAGNIGAADLARTAAALEGALATGGVEAATLLGQFEGQLGDLLRAIAPWVAAPSAPDAPAVPLASPLASPLGSPLGSGALASGALDPGALAALCQALARRDLAARYLFKDLYPSLRAHYGEAVAAELAESIAHLRFGEALARLQQGPAATAG